MRWELGRRSDNVEDTRGGGGGFGARHLSVGGVVVALVASYLFGVNPMQMLGFIAELQGDLPADSRSGAPPADDRESDFVRAILGETEDTWTAVFEASGARYEPPHLVLFSGMVRSGCGGATAASGPFYCPSDRKVYLDVSFFDDMRERLGGGGDFAQAYVIAHEVGHHVQTLLGYSRAVDEARQEGRSVEGADGPLVRQELQADCLAGVWAYHAQERHRWLDPGDAEQALATATAIGDDRLQRQSEGTVVPDAFTHGTSKQRVRWFSQGFQSGDVDRCDTFRAPSL
jgi:predicted metalloprotease